MAPTDFSTIKQQLAVRNLDRLAQIKPPSEPPLVPGFPDGDLRLFDIVLDILKGWSEDNKASIKESIQKQAFGGKNPINWNIAFLPFMESCAVYLRDWGKLVEAWQLYSEYKDGGSNDEDKLGFALSRYQEAHGDLEKLADVWNIQYVPICDLIAVSPEGHVYWDGPFCGAFCTKDEQKASPFIGIAFKGTNPFRGKELMVDLSYALQSSDFLNGEAVSEGVYGALFGKYKDLHGEIAYTFIIEQLGFLAQNLPKSDPSTNVRTHVTGHSLGGSYSSFCYAQLLIDATAGKLPKVIAPGDQYTFGAPRVGSQKWALFNRESVLKHEGLTWRIVNNTDIVPQVPPTRLMSHQLDFYHVETGMRIFSDKAPVTIPTEIGGPLPEPYPIPPHTIGEFIKSFIDTLNHIPNYYYHALVTAISPPPLPGFDTYPGSP